MNTGGRPPKYPAILAGVKATIRPGEWVVVAKNKRTRTGPSALRARYPDWQWRAVKNISGGYDLEVSL